MIEFDTNTNTYAVNINVKWYRDSTLLSDKDFIGNTAMCFCSNEVIAFNKVEIRITSMNLPNRYLKIFNIIDGLIRTFYKDELDNVDVLEEVTTKSTSMNINNTSISLIPKNDIGVLFQRTLPFKIYRDNDLYGCFFIDSSSSNTNRTVYKISANDYIGFLEYQTHLGGMYTSITAAELISEILGDMPYELDEVLGARILKGYLPIQTKREALRQVVFSIGGIVDTSRSENIIIKQPSTEIKSILTAEKIISIKKTELPITSSIELKTHSYKSNSEETELYNGELNSITYLTFSSPIHNLTITGGTILDYNVNYATIQGSGTVVLKGQGYDDIVESISKTNSNFATTDLQKIETHETTLNWNADELLNSLNFVKTNVEACFNLTGEQVGDLINVNGIIGRLTSISYSAEQNNIYAKTKLEVYDE